ncbi:dihydropteroate synthase [Campylobacter ureolyticus]|uniref:dihydropteroate synthase n=1 Tax=Campylobacter ureolyticus TaxID=827 RepID=UPI000468AC8C|nr:dihydropteroate synthase [Campylobacter ureolyticus]MCZ6172779.1 dihydropteroate synthase [Campylobacter ureolyticus]MCZ6186405.1 dihydropteroate synthase [Campylobacter ureolyticus]QIX85794.1 dihydropteroate synthase [Campylobacter ureolyticus]STA70445.1 dihydropteroate synthase [Campylobacter ureolyticus]
MKIFKIDNKTNFNEICKFIKPEKIGEKLMKKKSSLNFFFIKDLKDPAANILKQDALSIGAELVCQRGAILGQGAGNALLIANDKQLASLAKKEALQDFGLKNLSKFIKKDFIKPKKPEIMGVVNINEDSFNKASRVNTKTGIQRIEKQINDGASYIDLGGVSSRPGSKYCGRDEEFRRIKDIISEIYKLNLYEKAKFSLDSFDEYCLEYALNHGFTFINDISADLSLCKLAKKYNATYSLMHMKGDPTNMQKDPKYDDLIDEIDEFFKVKLDEIYSYGVKDIVLDPGIGFGKSASDNLFLIKHLEHFLHFNLPLFVGASRKSVINYYSKSEVDERLAGSLYLHLKAYENGATIIRTHDVFEHSQMFKLHEAMNKISIW